MARTSKNIESQDQQETSSAVDPASSAQAVKVTPLELAELLAQNPNYELSSGKKLVIHNMDVNDFLSAIAASDQPKRLQVLQFMMARYSLDINLEGSIVLGEFNIVDHSWTILPGTSGSLRILSKPAMVRRTVADVVSFLNMLPVGQALVLKPRQDLLIAGLSSDAMLDYYQFCQENQDAKVREKGQDEMFAKNCQTLVLKGLSLKIYGLNAAQVDRAIDVNAGGIVFRAIANEEFPAPCLVIALLPVEKTSI
jgi:hypothetical protein